MVETFLKLLLRHPELILVIIGALVGWWQNAKKKRLEAKQRQKLPEARRAPAQKPNRAAPARQAAPVAAAPQVTNETARRRFLGSLDELEREAVELASQVELERANFRFADVLGRWMPERIGHLRTDAGRQVGALEPALVQQANHLSLVLEEVKELIRQRRDKTLLPLLGDADALADACYRPIVTFARAEGLPLSTAWPATRLAPVNLSIWTHFAPTSLALLFLPPSFFQHIAWWPAIAHEIGHDFLVSVQGLDPALRKELSVPSEADGSRPLRPGPMGLEAAELSRLVGAWFEETFCDVFGTMMCGPAYVQTMTAVFSARQDAREVLLVAVDPRSRRYDSHPPRHLRVYVGCRVLDRAGLSEESERLWEAWNARHGFPRDEPIPLLVPIANGLVGVPFELFSEMVDPIVDQLYAGPLRALGGFGLSEISGLDYGPHEHAEAIRAKDALLSKCVPRVNDARAVIAGAVLAWADKPELEAELLERARAAIPAQGTFEVRPDDYQPAALEQRRTALDVSPSALLEALVLREVLERPSGPGTWAARAGRFGRQ